MLERISRKERFDLIVAWLAISIAFSLALTGGVGVMGGSPFREITLSDYLFYLILSMELADSRHADLAMLSVALRELRSLA